MKLDYIVDDSLECPLLRLYDFTPMEAAQLLSAVSELASEMAELVEVHRLPFVESIGGCRLFLVRKTTDQGVVGLDSLEFVCGFTASTWDNVAGLVSPFANGEGGFQWLSGSPGEASLLLSVSGRW